MLSHLSKLRLLAALSLVGAVALVGAAPALADSQVGNQNPNLLASASVLSSNPLDPNIARIGDSVRVELSVKNVSPTTQFVNIMLASDWVKGRNLDRSIFKELAPGASWSLSAQLQAHNSIPLASYSIGLNAVALGSLVESSAFGTVTVVQ